jgi:hypothetical protein
MREIRVSWSEFARRSVAEFKQNGFFSDSEPDVGSSDKLFLCAGCGFCVFEGAFDGWLGEVSASFNSSLCNVAVQSF